MSAGSTSTQGGATPVNLSLESLLRIADTLSSLERYATQTAVRLVLAEGGDGEAGEARGRIRYVEGRGAVREAVGEVLWRAEREILSAQPDGPGAGGTLEEAFATVRGPLARGVAMRTLFQHSARFSEPAKKYVQKVLAHGVEVRTLPEFFDPLIIVDGAIALIPGGERLDSAALIRDRAVVAFLGDVFERAWVRAERFPFRPVRAADAAGEVVPDMRQAIKALLIEGRSDKAIARRLGMSLRSVQGHIAVLREQYGAQHRFQLGYRMARTEAESLADAASAVTVPADGEAV
ncbi:LuxR family transcriptional regulator [Streptomyces sp. NBC_01198]|uniref:LuxR family transcriptional regulator n=1 Tax=Streptomyces sp. NBC_01198 TaxID=2903769 RepID=UPI002E0F9EBC|nr:LuxR family transcriptional regulator [Streptomyces sp. NBC_01198]